MAFFRRDDYRGDLKPGTKVEIAGTISHQTNEIGVMMYDSDLIKVLDQK